MDDVSWHRLDLRELALVNFSDPARYRVRGIIDIDAPDICAQSWQQVRNEGPRVRIESKHVVGAHARGPDISILVAHGGVRAAERYRWIPFTDLLRFGEWDPPVPFSGPY